MGAGVDIISEKGNDTVVGSEAQRRNGAMAKRYKGTMAQRHNGSRVQWEKLIYGNN